MELIKNSFWNSDPKPFIMGKISTLSQIIVIYDSTSVKWKTRVSSDSLCAYIPFHYYFESTHASVLTSLCSYVNKSHLILNRLSKIAAQKHSFHNSATMRYSSIAASMEKKNNTAALQVFQISTTVDLWSSYLFTHFFNNFQFKYQILNFLLSGSNINILLCATYLEYACLLM